MKKMGWDNQVRDLKSIDQRLETDEEDGMKYQMRDLLTKFTYQLETDEEDGMG